MYKYAKTLCIKFEFYYKIYFLQQILNKDDIFIDNNIYSHVLKMKLCDMVNNTF